MAEIRLQQVCKRYGDVTAVEDLNLHCRQGEMLALLDPSGCGKSSTLKMIAGIEPLTSGTIFFDDTEVSDLAPGARDIAMVFEDYALYPHLSVFDNVAFPLKIRGLSGRQIAARVEETLALLDLKALQHEPVTRLSGGAQQRVSIGRALVRDPELILFDEPLSHLDVDQKIQLRTEIRRLQQAGGLTSILVTHDQTEASAMADRIAVMNHGVLQQFAAPQTLYDHPASLFVANFIGEPPMNQLPVRPLRLSEDNLYLAGSGFTLQLPINGHIKAKAVQQLPTELIAGIRPEHVHVSQSVREAAAGTANVLKARVELRHPHGDTDVLRLSMLNTGIAISAEVSGPGAWRKDDIVTLNLAAGKLLLFDAATGDNLFSAYA
jgi:ABC-type sugar transport system ATPase subunit